MKNKPAAKECEKICVDCGGHGWVEDFATMSLAGYCKTCGGSGRIKKQVDATQPIAHTPAKL